MNVSEFARREAINPDCAAGSHRACRGDAWSMSKDAPCRCVCSCHADYPPVGNPYDLHPEEG